MKNCQKKHCDAKSESSDLTITLYTILNHDGMGKNFDLFGLNGPHLNYHGSCVCGYLFDLIAFSITYFFLSLNLFCPTFYFCHQFFFNVIKPLRPFSMQLDFS
jgi:hypothetical protein